MEFKPQNLTTITTPNQQAFWDVFSLIATPPRNVNTTNTWHVCFFMVAL